MKKTIFGFICAIVMSCGFASCSCNADGNDIAADSTAVDSTEVVDSVSADSVVTVDSVAADSVA